MDLFKPKDVLHREGDKVKVRIVGSDPMQSGNYGNYRPTNVIVDGKEYVWNIQEDHIKRIKESGCGAEFWIVAYMNSKGFIGFNYAPMGDVTATVGVDVTKKAITSVNESKDLQQEKMSRGAAWNNAVAYAIEKHKDNLDTPDCFCNALKTYAEVFAKYQSAFVNKEAVKVSEPVPQTKQADEPLPPLEEEFDSSELPF